MFCWPRRLSPASAREILAAKFIVYPTLGFSLALVIAGLNHPSILRSLIFWPALAVSVLGLMGVGLAISSIAKTQRTASLGAMCYMMTVALLLFICQQYGIPRPFLSRGAGISLPALCCVRPSPIP